MMLSRYARAIKQYVSFRLAPRADHADDVVQDVFLAAWENLGAYRGNSSLQSWLMGIARNKVKDYYRAHLREPYPLETAKENSGAKTSPLQVDDHLDKERARIKARRVLKRIARKIPHHFDLAVLGRISRQSDCQADRQDRKSHGTNAGARPR